MRHRRRRSLLRWLERLLWIAGCLLIGSYLFVYADRTAYQRYNEWAFERQLNHEPAPVIGFLLHSLSFTSPNPPPPPSADSAEQIVPQPKPARAVLRPGSLIGRMEIPRLGLRVMVLESTDSQTLRLAAGHIEGTALPGQPGNIGIAAHRDTFFRPLRDIRKDDEIELTTLDGQFRYTVEAIRIVGPDDTQVLANSGSDTLTLVTCYPFSWVGAAPKRFIVKAKRVDAASADSSAGPAGVKPLPSRGS